MTKRRPSHGGVFRIQRHASGEYAEAQHATLDFLKDEKHVIEHVTEACITFTIQERRHRKRLLQCRLGRLAALAMGEH